MNIGSVRFIYSPRKPSRDGGEQSLMKKLHFDSIFIVGEIRVEFALNTRINSLQSILSKMNSYRFCVGLDVYVSDSQ